MRNLKATDVPDLVRILEATGAFNDEEVGVAVELLGIVLNDHAQQDYEVAVAEVEGRVAGYVLFGPVPLTQGNFDLYWIAVDPAAQGHGVGRKLMAYVEEQARERGGRLVCLETSSQGSYERTRRFYEQAGYVEESRIRDFYKPGDDRLTYVKRLTALEEN
ncbi:GNAT family N-acetyltransferase [Geoalkalibacter sp.]|uniref:GNAT family N-acetyltransferase n=1 Tax=Geoalkalibacter sp. TaxID=3041440 RepID=UPI00272E52FF|nr:GNAT family N-acetyltransferase [Geoalkalibacter sp.]